MKKILFILSWLLSLIIISIYVNENPERIELIKDYFSKNKEPVLKSRIKSRKGEIDSLEPLSVEQWNSCEP